MSATMKATAFLAPALLPAMWASPGLAASACGVTTTSWSRGVRRLRDLDPSDSRCLEELRGGPKGAEALPCYSENSHGTKTYTNLTTDWAS